MEVKVGSVGGNRWKARSPRGSAHDFYSPTGCHVVLPQLGCQSETTTAGHVLAPDNDRPTVGSPLRLVHPMIELRRDRSRGGAIGVHHPDVELAGAIGDESDLFPVRRIARLKVNSESVARGQALGSASRERNAVDVAEEIENQRRAVGREVDRHPSAFAGFEIDGTRFATRRGDVPAELMLDRKGDWRGRGQKGESEAGRDPLLTHCV